MPKQHEEHVTTEQLSAFLDQQLPLQEQAFFDAHVRSCQRCQQALADMRQTVALLHALPQVEVPRSFVLPTRIALVPERQARQDATASPVSQRRRIWQYTLQRSVRAVSTIAAVLGLIFILSGFVIGLPHGSGTSATSAGSSNSPSMGIHASSVTTPAQPSKASNQPNNQGTSGPRRIPSPSPSLTPGPVPTPTATATTPTSSGPPSYPAQTIPPALDLSKPEGHVGIGSILLVLGILGIVFTRRR